MIIFPELSPKISIPPSAAAQVGALPFHTLKKVIEKHICFHLIKLTRIVVISSAMVSTSKNSKRRKADRFIWKQVNVLCRLALLWSLAAALRRQIRDKNYV
jgi:hypothetical protein